MYSFNKPPYWILDYISISYIYLNQYRTYFEVNTFNKISDIVIPDALMHIISWFFCQYQIYDCVILSPKASTLPYKRVYQIVKSEMVDIKGEFWNKFIVNFNKCIHAVNINFSGSIVISDWPLPWQVIFLLEPKVLMMHLVCFHHIDTTTNNTIPEISSTTF